MKKLTLISLLFIATTCFSQGKGYVINGTMKNANDNAYIYLTHKYYDVTHVDSTLLRGGKFTFKGKTPEPNMYWITLTKSENPVLIFFADNTSITIDANKDSLAYARIKGGATEEDYKTWLQMQFKYGEMRKGLIQQYNAYGQANDQINAKRIFDTAGVLERRYVKDIEKFIKTHPQSNVGAYAIFSVVFDWPKIRSFGSRENCYHERSHGWLSGH
jgi:hypothetical protein